MCAPFKSSLATEGSCLRARDSSQHQFAMMTRCYRERGGLLTCDEVARLVGEHAGQSTSRVAHWIVDRSVVSLSWRAQIWLPLFQFESCDMSLRPGAERVVRELAPVFDDWDLAVWFTNPNGWLDEAMPLEVLAYDLAAVLDAARADRFVVKG